MSTVLGLSTAMRIFVCRNGDSGGGAGGRLVARVRLRHYVLCGMACNLHATRFYLGLHRVRYALVWHVPSTDGPWSQRDAGREYRRLSETAPADAAGRRRCTSLLQ